MIYIVFHTFSHFFIAVQDVLWTEHKEAHCLLEKFIREEGFSFSLLHFWVHFLGTHYVWTLTFSVWIWPWFITRNLLFLPEPCTLLFLNTKKKSRAKSGQNLTHWRPKLFVYVTSLQKTVDALQCIVLHMALHTCFQK